MDTWKIKKKTPQRKYPLVGNYLENPVQKKSNSQPELGDVQYASCQFVPVGNQA